MRSQGTGPRWHWYFCVRSVRDPRQHTCSVSQCRVLCHVTVLQGVSPGTEDFEPLNFCSWQSWVFVVETDKIKFSQHLNLSENICLIGMLLRTREIFRQVWTHAIEPDDLSLVPWTRVAENGQLSSDLHTHTHGSYFLHNPHKERKEKYIENLNNLKCFWSISYT